MPQEWITQQEAAVLLGVHKSAVPKMIARGDLHPRWSRPSLMLQEVEALKLRRWEAARDIEARRAAPPKGPQPPDAERDWILGPAAAAVLGCSVGALGNRVNRGQVPCTLHAGRRWFRLDLLELQVRARVAQESGAVTRG